MSTDRRTGSQAAMARRAALSIALAAATALGFSVVPSVAEADVSCFRTGTDLTVEVTDGFASTLLMNPPFIEVHTGSGEIVCGGDPTTSNVDTILVNDLSSSAFDTNSEIDLTGGPFAPGQTDEASSSTDEIEFVFSAMEKVDFTGTAGADDLRFGSVGAAPRANLNGADEGTSFLADVDVTFSGLDRIRVDAGASGDVVSGDGATFADSPFHRPMTILGGAEGDDLRGGSADDTIGFTTEPGNDSLAGGVGDDRVAANIGDDEVDGGPGTDMASYLNAPSAVTVDLATASQQNTGGGGLDTLTAVEDLTGSLFGDTLRGDGGANRLNGDAGGDTIEGRAGADEAVGDSSQGDLGDDVLLVRDGTADAVTCLGGVDTVTADQLGIDSIPADCESVSFAPLPVTPEAPPKKCKKGKRKKGSKVAGAAKKRKQRCKRKRKKR